MKNVFVLFISLLFLASYGNSSEPFPAFHWDRASLDSLRAIYNAEFAKYDRFPSAWAGARGEVNEETRHLAAAGGWGLFPEKEAIYINSISITMAVIFPATNAIWRLIKFLT